MLNNHMVNFTLQGGAMEKDTLSVVFAALADPTRRAILSRLAQGEATVNELAQPFAMTLPAVSKHLRVLERAGLIRQRRVAQQRPCRIDSAPLIEISQWVEQYRHLWEARFDRLDDYLGSIQEQKDQP
jgi:DNA-binding transcriptional ArsR family regulator